MKFVFNIFLVSLALFLGCQSESINQDVIFKKVDRDINLVNQIVKIKSKITVENAGSKSIKSFLYAVEPEYSNYVSWISVTVGGDRKPLVVSETTVSKHSNVKFWLVTLQSPIESGKTVSVNVDMMLTHALDPFPSHISQSEKQFVLYYGNHFLYTPYKVLLQITSIKLPVGKVESYTKTKKPASLADSVLTYGPYENTEPFAMEKLKIHNENNNPFLSVTKLERVIEISHWGNIAVEEKINVRHDGAVLKGSFSRYEYQTEHSGVSAVKGYKTVLPSSAADVYYRDEIGNISTSHLRNLDDAVELELKPRFPLFGGWKTQYTVGYNLPSYEYLFSSGNQFGLNMRFIDHLFDDQVIDDATVKIILPEGCSNIKIEIPYPVKREKDSIHYTYLDVQGRPVITVHKANMVENHIQDFKMYYNFEKVLMLQEPLLVVVALYLLFLLVIIYVRLDFSISQDEAAESKLKVSGYCTHVASHQEKREDVYIRYSDAMTKYKTSKDNNSFQNTLKKLNAELKTETQAIADLLVKLKGESGDTSEKVAELQKLDKSMKDQLSQQNGYIDKLVSGKLSKQAFIDSENGVNKRKDELLDKMEAIVSHL